MITAVFTDNSDYARATGLWQWDYGQRLRIEGLKLPTAVEIHFALTEFAGDAIPRVGTTKDGVTEVVIPDSLLENLAAGATYEIYAWIYLADKTTGETIKRISMQVKCRPKPEAFDAPGDAEIFRDAIAQVNASADRAEAAREGAEAAQKAAEEAAGKIEGEITGAGQIAEQVKRDAEAVAKDKQAVSQLATETTQNAQKAAEAAQAAERSSTAAKEAQTAAESAKAGAESAMKEVERDRTEVSETHRAVEQLRGAVDMDRQAVAADRRAVENTALQFGQAAQSALTAIGQAQDTAVGAVSAEGQKQTTAVQQAGTQAVSGVETAKTEAVQAVTTEGDSQTKRVQDAAAGIVADREQIAANKAGVESLQQNKADAIVETAQGETMTLTDSSDKLFRGLRVFGRSTQVKTTGAQLLPEQAVSNYFISLNGDIVGKNNSDYSKIIQNTENTTYYIFRKNVGTRFRAAYVDAIPTGNTPCTGVVDDTKDNISITVPAGKVLIINMEDTKAFDGLMVQKTRDRLPYEPYTGGKPSPSPEYPQELEDAGQDEEIGINVTGKNLLTGRLYYVNYSNGVGYIDKDTHVSLPYMPTEETKGIGYVIPCVPEKHYTFSVTNPNENAVVAISEYKTFEDAKDYKNAIGFAHPRSDSSLYGSVYTSKGNGVLVCWIAGKWTNGNTTLHECTESELLQLEIGSEATPYEPPRTPQTLTLQTPNGLPGVPVSKDGNYTDADGQQWVCDEIDLKRGKYVQRVAIEKNNGGWELKPSPDISGRFFQSRLTNVFQTAVKTAVCNIANFVSWGAPTNDIYAFALNKKVIYFSPPKGAEITAEELNAKLNSLSFPVVVVGELATPIERDLTPEEIAAYKALRTYGPTTVITNDAGAGMEVTYVADTKNYIRNLEERLNAKLVNIQSALISQKISGGGYKSN